MHSAEEYSLLTQAAEAIAEINLQIAELEEQKKGLLNVFKNEDNGLVPRKEPYDFGRVQVKVSEYTRIDDGLARRNLTEDDYGRLTKQTLDTTLARKVLKPETLELITKRYDNKIEVKIK